MSATTVDHTTRDGHPALTLRAGELAATFVPQLGMIGASLEHRGQELLGQRKGLAAYADSGSTMGIPLLHPWANRLSERDFDLAGKHVAIDSDSPHVRIDPNGLPIHGLLAANPGWRVDSGDSNGIAAKFDFGAHPDLVAMFPFPHELQMSVTLDPHALTITTTLLANAGSAVPVAFGFHPYLTLPDVPRADWHVELPVTEHLPTDERGIPTGARQPVTDPSGPLGQREFDDGYAGLPDPATFVLVGGDRRIEVTFDGGYRFAQVYAPPEHDLICFEPMTAATNAFVAGGPGLQVLAPGESHSATFSIAVSDR